MNYKKLIIIVITNYHVFNLCIKIEVYLRIYIFIFRTYISLSNYHTREKNLTFINL